MLKFFVLVLTWLFISIYAEYKSELVMVLTICRHGMRTPSGTYKNDPFKNSSPWGVNYGQLTNHGKMQQYNLGKWFRKRYTGFLPTKYSRRDFVAFSTSVDRCIESASACVAGIYPPERSEMFDPSIHWQPIPIHSSKDELIHERSMCTKQADLLAKLYDRDVYKKLVRENEKFFQYISEMTGESIKTLHDLRMLYGIIHIQNYFNVTFPEWIRDSYDKMHCLSQMELVSHTYTTELARMMMGPMIDRILNTFDATMGNETRPVKFLMFSAHEGTLVNLLNTLKLYDYHWPDFADSIIFELRKDDKKYFVNMLYKNSTTLSKLSLPDCAFSCELEKFKKILKPKRLSEEEWRAQCQT